MRIVAGTLGGRTIEQPSGRDTRPVTHKVRAALFDMLGPLDGLMVLDAYAGSGALGFEALSRGAIHVDAIELAGPALKAIQRNIETLRVEDRYKVVPMRVESFLQKEQRGYNLILADPPYDQLTETPLESLGGLLEPDGIMVLSHTSKQQAPSVEALELVKTKSYGDSTLSVYRLKELAEALLP